MRKGQKHTAEAKEKNRSWHIGKPLLEETKRKMRLVAKGFCQKHKLESRNKMSTTKKKLYAEGKIKPWSYIDGKASERERLNTHQVHKIWCEANNIHRVPSGCVIHHLDLNPTNNHPSNLQLLDRQTHSIFHNEIIKMIKNQEVSVWPN